MPPVQAPPQFLHGEYHRHNQWAFNAHSKVEARGPLAGDIPVVLDIDATDEADFSIDDAQLAMQAHEPGAFERPPAMVAAINPHFASSGFQRLPPVWRQPPP